MTPNDGLVGVHGYCVAALTHWLRPHVILIKLERQRVILGTWIISDNEESRIKFIKLLANFISAPFDDLAPPDGRRIKKPVRCVWQ